MEEFNFNTSEEKSFNYSNMSLNNSDTHYGDNYDNDYDNYDYNNDFNDNKVVDNYNNDYYDYDNLLIQIRLWVNWITIGIGLPLILIVMIAVVFQVKKGQDAPVYVINLLVSDLIQLCCRMSSETDSYHHSILITLYGVFVSVGFMVCISCERYLVIAKPLWYRFRRNIKTYVVVCSLVWILPVVYLIMIYVAPGLPEVIICTVFLLLPFPLFIFFLVGTIKALSGALRVPADEKRRIVAIQAVVLLNYTLLYLPIIIWLLDSLEEEQFNTDYLTLLSLVCIFLSPLADTTLYLLSRKSIIDKFLASLCSKMCNNLELSSTDCEIRPATDTETV